MNRILQDLVQAFVALDGGSSQTKTSQLIETNPHLLNRIVTTGYEDLKLMFRYRTGWNV